jgi:Cu/Ag efflux pump CusA
VKLVPFYDRTTLVAVTTSTVLHNLIFGCLLIFLIQWIFLGDLRSAIIVGVNIPFALFFSIIILVLRNEDANLLSVGAVDFGIIVDAAVILVENIYRNCQARPEDRQSLLQQLAEQKWGADPTRGRNSSDPRAWTDRLRLILVSGLQVDRTISFSPRSLWRPSCHCSLCRGSKARFSGRWREPMPTLIAGAVEEAQQRISRNVKLPTGYRIEWAGEFEWLQQAKKRLAIILPITFVLIMLLLYGLFNSLRDSLLALLGLPFAVSGGILGLYVSGLHFSISAAIGFISLFGVSVMSGILIINGYYRVAASGMDPVNVMFRAVEEQMRPILMMTLSACIGLLPAAISTGIGSQVQRPLATVIVGGMLVGPILLLVVVPALQSYFLRRDVAADPRTVSADES